MLTLLKVPFCNERRPCGSDYCNRCLQQRIENVRAMHEALAKLSGTARYWEYADTRQKFMNGGQQ